MKRPFCTTKTEFSIGTRPSPVMSLAPSYATAATAPVRDWPCARHDHPAAASRHVTTSKRAGVSLTLRTIATTLRASESESQPNLHAEIWDNTRSRDLGSVP